MKTFIILWQIVAISLLPLSASTFYVRTDGNNTNTGLANNPQSALVTLQFVISKIKAGDTVIVNNGEYISEGVYFDSIHGLPDKPIVIKAVQPFAAKISRTASANPDKSVVEFSNSSYIIFDGFEVFDNIVGNESGVDVRNSSHHITVSNCYIRDCACGGIVSRLSDYLVFEKNIVRDNAKRNKWNCSGISIWHPVELNKDSGFHIIIRKNVAFENECDLAFAPFGFKNPTDGNGIIIDDFLNTQGGGQEGGYRSEVLVENNLCFNNGGRGINVFHTNNATIRNNTCYHNLYILSKYFDWAGEISVDNSLGTRIYNNIVVRNPNVKSKALRCYDNDSLNTKVYNNLLIGEKDFCGQKIDERDNIIQDIQNQNYPKFTKPTVNENFISISDFKTCFGLQVGSPAIHTGCNQDAPKDDLNGTLRLKNKTTIGCYSE